jgi:hypothetical protein
MNGRTRDESTPAARVAAAARALSIRMQTSFPKRPAEFQQPDYADFREALEPHIDRELCMARLDEIRKSHGTSQKYKEDRERELVVEFVKLDLIVARLASE